MNDRSHVDFLNVATVKIFIVSQESVCGKFESNFMTKPTKISIENVRGGVPI